jgi:hypothetical protein
MARTKDRSSSHSGTHLLLIIILFLMSRTLFLQTPAGQLGDADQAVFGMMAEKIAALEEFPIYCWEAHYAGAPVAYLAAVIFHFWGIGFVQLRWAMILIVFPAYMLVYFIYRRLFDRQMALVGILFLIFAPYVVLNFTTAAYGGYGESFLGTALIILLSWKIDDRTISLPLSFSCFLLGLTCGFFTYIHVYVLPTIIAFAFPTLWRLGKERVKPLWTFCLGGIIGILPMILYNVMHGGGTLTRGAAWISLTGRKEASMAYSEVVENILLKKGVYLKEWLFNAPLMFGQYAVPPLFGNAIQAAAGLVLIAALMAYTVRSIIWPDKEKRLPIFQRRQFAFSILIFMLFYWIVSLHAVRHFIPLFAVIPVALVDLTHKHPALKKGALAVLMLMSALQVWGWHYDFKTPRFDPRPVVETMKNEGIREFYASYWTCYPIMFLARGALIGSPLLSSSRLPFSDRRPQYTEQVDRSLDSAFVFEAGGEKEFLTFLRKNQIDYKMIEVGQVSLFCHFSKPVGVDFNKENFRNYFFLK